MHPQLRSEIVNHQNVRQVLLEAFPDIDDETLGDTLEGESNLAELLADVVRSSMEDRSLACALKERVSEMRERLTRLQTRADQKRSIVRDAMESAGLKRIIEPYFSISLGTAPPSMVVVDKSAIPGEFWFPQPDKLDRHAVLLELKAGYEVFGAKLSDRKSTMTVRTK